MANDRKRRKIRIVKPIKSKEKNPVNKPVSEEESKAYNSNKLKVVSGTRKKRKIIGIITYSIIALIFITIIVLNILSPTGLIESIQNAIAAGGNGSLPQNVYSVNPEYMNCYNDVCAIINDSYFELYSSKGKLINAVSHGMSSPRLEYSEARYLLYDSDRYKVTVFNYSDELYSREFDKTIVSADIGRNGTFSVVTDSDSFHNTVYVYNKKNELIFTWNSAQYYVTDVALSDDGKSIAVSLLNSVEGKFESFIYILDMKKATPKFSYKLNDIVSSITSCGKQYFIVNGFDRAYSIPWSGGAENDLNISGIIRCYANNVDGVSCVVSGRQDNEQVNKITVCNQNGSVISSVDFKSVVYDVSLSESAICILSENEVYVYDFKGNLLNNFNFGFKGKFVGIFDTDNVFVLDNTKLNSVH